MNVGMIFECGPHGADVQVCRALAQRLVPTINISHATLDRKPKLVAECGKAAAALLAEGCERVFIVWDLYPAWRERNARPCRHDDRESIYQSLRTSGVRANRVQLVCIEEELEAWLLADGRALSAVLSRPTHPVKIKHTKNPDGVGNPKGVMRRLFSQNGHAYNDLLHAKRIVENVPDFARLRDSITFRRFAERLTGQRLR